MSKLNNKITNQFFNVFWNSKGCRRLFLLHKSELLESQTVEFEGEKREVFRPRLIVSNNYNQNESSANLTIKANSFLQKVESSFETKGHIIQPKIEEFFKSKFGKSFDKLEKDLSGTKIISLGFKVAKFISNPEKNEAIGIKLLQDYGFIGKHIDSFDKLGEYVEGAIKRNFKKIITEEHVFHFYDSIELGRFFYYSVMYKSLLKSNKIMANAFHDTEYFQDRLEIISLLQDENLLRAGRSETYFQCLNCKSGTSFGSAIIDVKLKNMKKFMCPVCSEPYFYLAPLEIHPIIYKMITSNDGILLHAISDCLRNSGYKVENNVLIGSNNEIDALAEDTSGNILFVESKMFEFQEKEISQLRKLRKAIKEIISQIDRLKGLTDIKRHSKYYLITNLNDPEIQSKLPLEIIETLNQYQIEILDLDSFESRMRTRV